MTLARAYVAPPPTNNEIENRVRTHMQLAQKLAWQIHGRVRDILDIDDLTQISMISLIEAAQRFEDNGQATFGHYATMRIRGALTDYLRKNLALSRTSVKRRAKIREAEQKLMASGKDHTNQKLLAAEIGISIAELQSWKDQSSTTKDQSLDQVYDDHSVWFADYDNTPETALVADDLRRSLATHLKKLDARDALILQLYYVEELNLLEIAEVLQVTEGRVSQMKKAALSQLRDWMKKEID